MDITGNMSNYYGDGQSGKGAFYTRSANTKVISQAWQSGVQLSFRASRSWSGSTSSDGGSDARPTNFTKKLWVRVS